MVAQVSASHAATIEVVIERSLQKFATFSQQTFASLSANTPTVRIHRTFRARFVSPVALSAIRLRDIRAMPDRFQIKKRVVAVIALVCDDFLRRKFVQVRCRVRV